MNDNEKTAAHELELLENGREYYDSVFEAIREAREEVMLETFIWFWDDVGKELMSALEVAAGNGATVEITVDGFGTPNLPEECLHRMSELGIKLHIFDPTPRIFGFRPKWVGRLHRKLAVVDNQGAGIEN